MEKTELNSYLEERIKYECDYSEKNIDVELFVVNKDNDVPFFDNYDPPQFKNKPRYDEIFCPPEGDLLREISEGFRRELRFEDDDDTELGYLKPHPDDNRSPESSNKFPNFSDLFDPHNDSECGLRYDLGDDVRLLEKSDLLSLLSTCLLALQKQGENSKMIFYELKAAHTYNELKVKFLENYRRGAAEVYEQAVAKISKELEIKIKSDMARKAAAIRHLATTELRGKVISEWRENIYPSYPKMSNDKAAKWLTDSFPNLSPRKIAAYVGEGKKEMAELLSASKA